MYYHRGRQYPAGETVTIEIEYQHGTWPGRTAVFPAPAAGRRAPIHPWCAGYRVPRKGSGARLGTRYRPGARCLEDHAAGFVVVGGRGSEPGDHGVDLNAGLDLAEVVSTSHRIEVVRLSHGRYRVEPAGGKVPGGPGFRPALATGTGTAARRGIVHRGLGGRHYGLLMVMPPHARSCRDLSGAS